MIFDVLCSFLVTPLILFGPPGWVDQDYCVVSNFLSVEEEERKLSEALFEDVLLGVAASSCKNVNPKKVDSQLLLKLLQIEKHIGIPVKYRGMVLAAACNESGYSSKARGDGGKAVGILQMWPWWERRYKVNRTDPYASATAWLTQIMRTLPKARRKCGKRRAFVSAWAWVASGPKKWKCRAPRHYKRLRWWHREVNKAIES